MKMGTESTSNSLKFPPLRLSELKQLMAFKLPVESPDTSYSAGEESEGSPRPSPKIKSNFPNASSKSNATERSACWTPGQSLASCVKSENKENDPFVSDHRNVVKEHFPDRFDGDTGTSHCTYPGRNCGDESCPTMQRHSASEIKKKNILSVRNYAALKTAQSSLKCTPDHKQLESTPIVKTTNDKSKAPFLQKNGTPKIKTSTPVFKQRIRRNTPGSSGQSGKCIQQQKDCGTTNVPNVESVRCLFPKPIQQLPETPDHGFNKENNPFTNNPRIVPDRPDEPSTSSSCTHPEQNSREETHPTQQNQSTSEVKKRNVLSVRNSALKITQSSSKRTPDYNNKQAQSAKSTTPAVKPANEKQKCTPMQKSLKTATPKIKTSTPVVKQGVRRYTPGSSGRPAKYSQRKDSAKNPTPSRDSARCLFPEPVGKSAEAPAPAPETPCNRSAPAPAATPSYPNTNSNKISLNTMVINGKSYMYIKKLGSGGSSEVYKVLEVGGERGEYAVKSVNMAVERNLAQGYINEIRLLRELQSSDRVIRLHAYEYDKASQSLKVVLEVGETDLSSFLRARQATGLPPALILYYWGEMLHAVNHIHQHGVVHADLKPANFLLVCGRLKLIDFGIASAISTDATSVVRPCAAGTFSYISPEALMGGAGRFESGLAGREDAPIKISFKSDVWSLGCILYSMVYGFTPFGHINNVIAKIAAIVDPKHVINYPPVDSIPPNLITAMKWCLTYNAKSRPSVKQLLSIDYLRTSTHHLPQPLLDKVKPHVTEEEFNLLQNI